jgi:hypothetical protein
MSTQYTAGQYLIDRLKERVVTFLVGTLGIVLVTLLTWFVLLVVR